MDLPVMPPVKPMLAKSVAKIPPGMQYEAKWDGFRAIVFRDGDEVELGSRTGKPLTRYFPELAGALRERLPERCVVDGEIVIAREGHLDFDALTERIHPADSRVRTLAERTPASFVAFDLLALADESLLDVPLSDRRTLLVRALRDVTPPVHVAPATTDVEVARGWFEQYEGAGLDGVVAKPLDLRYRQDEDGPCSRSSTSARRTWWSPGTGCTRADPWWARCCWACTTPRAPSSTWACRPPSR